MDVRPLPKIELHLHLDCSLSYEAVSHLAPSVTREEYDNDYVAPAKCANLADFLKRAPKGFQLMQDEYALRHVTEDVFRQLKDDGVIYVELRFAPLLHVQQGLRPEQVVAIVDRAAEDMIRQTGVEARLILCTLRHFTETQSMVTAQLVKQFKGSRVVALDLAGDEAGFPLKPHMEAYGFAREHELLRTAHAGEASGPESVWETLLQLKPMRIGHGVRSIEDLRLVEFLANERIHLEMCPSSNVQIVPSINDWSEHPIHKLLRLGVPLNVNTDTRMLNAITLTSEYEGLMKTFGWGPEEFLKTNLMAVDAAFVEDEVKQRLRKTVLEAYAGEPA
ncbi:MAG: adenosine deaminase [Terriglobales bacterium]